MNVIYNEDCLIGLVKIPDETIDLIVTDPPFGIDFQKTQSMYNRKTDNVVASNSYHDVPVNDYYDFTSKWMSQAYRILKQDGSMYVFSGWNNLKDVLTCLDVTGFKTVNHIIWKYQFGVYTKNKFVTSHYHLLYVCKNIKKRKFYNTNDAVSPKDKYRDLEDVWVIKREYWRNELKTPTKLPSEIINKILKYSSKENDVVCDPFIGSGQVAFVAKSLKRNYIGFEISKDYFDFAIKRLTNI